MVETEDTVGAVVSVVVLSVEVELSSEGVVVLSLVVDAPSSLLLLQEMMVKLKRNMEKMMSICLTWFPISGLGEPYIYHNLEDFTRKWEVSGVLSDSVKN